MKYLLMIVLFSGSLLAMEQESSESHIFSDAIMLTKRGEEAYDYTKALIPYSPVSFAHMPPQGASDKLPVLLLVAPKSEPSVNNVDSTKALIPYPQTVQLRALAAQHREKQSPMKVSKELTWTHVFNAVFGSCKKKKLL